MGLFKRYWVLIALALVVFFGSLFRLYKLDQIPMGYTYDETAITYDAWAISLWHRDQFAHFMPLTFESFGDYKPPLLIYFLAAIFSLTGLHEVTIRLVAAFAGIGSIIVMYFLATTLFKKELDKRAPLAGLIAAAVVAFSPWSIQLSRIGFEQNLAFFLGLTGLWLFIKGLAQPRWWLLASIMMAASIYTFHTAKIFIPLCLLLLGIFFWKELLRFKKWTVLAVLALVICLVPFIYSSVKQQSNSRSIMLIAFSESGTLRPFLEIGSEFISNTVNQLSPAFWVTGWDAKSIRHSVPGYGVLLVPPYIIFLATLLWIGLKNRTRTTKLLVWLWVIGLMPALISRTTPHVIRSQFTLIATVLLISYGITHLFLFLRSGKKTLAILFTSAVLVLTTGYQLTRYCFSYFGEYALSSASAFQYGYREAVTLLNENKRAEDTIFVTNDYAQPYIYLLLYNRITPQAFLFGGLNQYKIMPINWSSDPEKGLYLATPEEIPLTDPRVIRVISVPKSLEPVLVIARNP